MFSTPLITHVHPNALSLSQNLVSYSCFWPQLTSAKCCNITTERQRDARRRTHTHAHTLIHSRFCPAVQLPGSRCFAQLFSSVMHFCYAVVFPLQPWTITQIQMHMHTVCKTEWCSGRGKQDHLKWPLDSICKNITVTKCTQRWGTSRGGELRGGWVLV